MRFYNLPFPLGIFHRKFTYNSNATNNVISLLVVQKADFPFAQVPVPTVTYKDDQEPIVTLLCSFNFSNWNNVSFEIQWFIDGSGSKPQRLCENSDSQCDVRNVELSGSEYVDPHFRPGSQVIELVQSASFSVSN